MHRSTAGGSAGTQLRPEAGNRVLTIVMLIFFLPDQSTPVCILTWILYTVHEYTDMDFEQCFLRDDGIGKTTKSEAIFIKAQNGSLATSK